ncbi:insulinase family protein [Noviherbaspirillum galbum]|uniref:Peptidase M16 n=1 Tax=Noviherbaspirillum galbum TaxID=2709383 RepID=A0A6B3STY2_9BURK|nr:insulinase family protein [Noviherbaspirillum galbum]NEX61089.1 peptidase M16 [Noviherbaspirillum galbum]
MAFIEQRSRQVTVMQAQLTEFLHPETGARHLHLATDDAEMAFLVAFPTVPHSSDGRAHILEHLALCGSARFPVRDPFFAMLRRSVSTFMNAMTYPDRTVYPFASTDKADFFNLLDIYLDAAFFPKLDYLDFLQEGWRHTFEQGKLGYGGVVFNEMKGAFADPMRALNQGLSEVLFRDTTYAVESGGDPLDIPSLTLEDLRAFHASHYHPSQAVFMTAGRVDPREVQQVIAERVLSRLGGREPRMRPELAMPFAAPQETTVRVPSAAAGEDEYGIQFAWLCGERIDIAAYCRMHLLDAGLIGDASAPVMRAMESAGYGRPSAFNGLDPGSRQMVFHLGMEGLTQSQTKTAGKRIWSALEEAAETGVPREMLEAALRDFRFSQRQIKGGHTPYGLRKLLHALPLEMVGGDAIDALDLEPYLQRIEQELEDPDFFKAQVRALLASTSRLTATVVPDANYFALRDQAEQERLAASQASLSAEEIAAIERDCAALLQRQRTPSDNSILPRIKPQDVSPLPPASYQLPPDDGRVLALPVASNGISSVRVIYDLSAFPPDDWAWLSLYGDLLPDLGVGRQTFDQASAWRQKLAASFKVQYDADEPLTMTDTTPRLRQRIVFSAENLREGQGDMAGMLAESIRHARFDESERIAFLIDSAAQDLLQGIAEDGNQYASLVADAPYSLTRQFQHTTDGVGAIGFYRWLAEEIESDEGLDAICRRLAQLHERVLAAPVQILALGLPGDVTALARHIDGLIPATSPAAAEPGVSIPLPPPASSALTAPAQVNHCFATWAVPRMGHEDAPALYVLANLLTNQVLHQALREEGGAYGGRARYDFSAGLFGMLSYRDPRVAGTYADFARAIEWVIDSPLNREHIEEAIIGVIGDLDKPQSPVEEALSAWRRRERGVTQSMRESFRAGVLGCTEAGLKNVANTWLANSVPSRAAFVGNPSQDLGDLAVVELLATPAGANPMR